MPITDSLIAKLIQGNVYEDASKWAIPISALQLVLSFLLMGAISEDYLATNVNLLCNSSNLLVSILMAFCNSSPDLISNFVAWYGAAKEKSGVKTTADTLALSEVLGACGTVMFIAVGCVLIGFNKIYKHINRQTFEQEFIESTGNEILLSPSGESQARNIEVFTDKFSSQEYRSELKYLLVPLINKLSNDLFFFSIGILLVIICCGIESISIFMCLLLLISYTGFMLNNIRHHRKHGNSLINYENAVEDTIELQTSNELFINNDQQEADNIFKQQAEPSSFLEDGNFEFFLSVLEEEEDDKAVWKDARGANILGSDSGIDANATENRVPSLGDANETPFEHYSDNPLDDDTMTNYPIVYNNLQKEHGIMSLVLFQKVVKFILPYYEKFQRKSVLRKLSLLATTPVLLLISLTCPRFSKSIPESDGKFAFLLAQSYFSVFFSIFALMIFFNRMVFWPLISLTFLFGSALLYIQVSMRNKYKKVVKISFLNTFAEFPDAENNKNDAKSSLALLDEFRKELSIFSIIGIVNSIIWIVIMSNNLIGTIEYYQEVFHISETILGLTFFAWGNSVPDILTNVAVLKLYNHDIPEQILGNKEILYKWQVQSLIKYSQISLVTCISSSTINSMIGIGFNAFIAILLKRPFKLAWELSDISSKTHIHLLISASCILFVMLFIGIILKIVIKNDHLFQRYLLDGYFVNKRLLMSAFNSEEDSLDMEQSQQDTVFDRPSKNFAKYKHNKIVKYIGIGLISTWVVVTLVNVLVEVVT